jgi:hypothetical protein
MSRTALAWLALPVVAALSASATIGMEIAYPYVIHDLQALPGHALSETVLTKAPQSIDVTVARVPTADAITIDQWRPGWPGETLDPRATIVRHFVSAPDAQGGSPLEHHIQLPPLGAGLYQVRLHSPEQTAFQDLNVGTLAAMINRGYNGAVLMAFDRRTMRQRTAALVLDYTPGGLRRFSPSNDGLFHLPPGWPAHGPICSKDGGIVVTASDGSIIPFGPDVPSATGPCRPQMGLGTYLDTDRHIYRPGDRVYYRMFSRAAVTTDQFMVAANITWFGNLVQSMDHVATGSFVLPATGFDYWHPGEFVVTDAARSRYQVEAAAQTPRVNEGSTATFVLSAALLDGTPPAGLHLRYGWHGTNVGENFPLRERAYGTNGGGPADLAYGDAALDSFGNATVTVPVDRNDVDLYVFDPDTNELVAGARAVVDKAVPSMYRGANLGNDVLLLSLGTPAVRPGTSAALTATSSSNGDALVFSGSAYDFNTKVARVRDGMAHVRAQAPPDLDDFTVGISQPMRDGQQWAYADVAVAPKRHLLHVQLGCLSGKVSLCIRVSNWHGAEVPARLFVDVTTATRAAIVNAMTRSDAAYKALYTPLRTDFYSFTSSWSGSLAPPGTSYLYTMPSRSGVAPSNHSPAPTPQPTPSPAPRTLPSETILWLNAVPTGRTGYLKVSLGNLRTQRLYLIHVIALSADAEIGEAYTWTFR